jgi:hypothetical protein
MDVHVRDGPAEPFLGARDLFATEHDLEQPVSVQVTPDPGERTRVSHGDEGHLLTISRAAATSALARELALHEFAHMRRHEQAHPSHVQSTEEAIYLALAGKSVERRRLAHCYQIANHAKDIYADDVWVPLAPADKLVPFLESSLAAAVEDAPRDPPTWQRLTPAADPDITAVNAAFALALCERHDLLGPDHRLYDLARVAAADAPGIDLSAFKERFRTLARDTDESEYRQDLVDLTQAYATAAAGEQAAD